MSLNRTALRLGTVLALSNNVTAPYPTMAEARIFDSRMDAAAIAEDVERQPYIVVYTDDDMGEQLSTNNGGPPWARTIDLVLHMAVGAHGIIQNPETGEEITGFGPIETDSDCEAVLDLLEYQAERALFGRSSWAQHWQDLHIGVSDKVSVRFGDPRDARVKYSERMVIYKIAIKDDFITDPSANGLPAHISALAAAVATPGSAYIEQTVATLTAFGLPAEATLPPLRRVRIIEAEKDAQGRLTNPRSQPPTPGVAQANIDT